MVAFVQMVLVFVLEIGLVLYVVFLLVTALETVTRLQILLEVDVIKLLQNVIASPRFGDRIVNLYCALVTTVPKHNVSVNVILMEHVTLQLEFALARLIILDILVAT